MLKYSNSDNHMSNLVNMDSLKQIYFSNQQSKWSKCEDPMIFNFDPKLSGFLKVNFLKPASHLTAAKDSNDQTLIQLESTVSTKQLWHAVALQPSWQVLE